MKESELENKFRAFVKQAGGKAYKFVSPGNDGVPDRLVIFPGGRVGFVELKQTGQKPRKLQEHRMQELRELGCFVSVVDSTESAQQAIGAILSQNRVDSDTFFELVNRMPYRREP